MPGASETAATLDSEFAAIEEFWSPRVVAAANGQFVKIAKVSGEFVWHAHDDEDEFFLVERGRLGIRFRDRADVILTEGGFTVVPRGVEHCPYTIGGEAWIILVEPAATKHTGDVVSERTRAVETQRAHLG